MLSDRSVAGGWTDTETLLNCYRQADPTTMLAVMSEPTKVRELVAQGDGARSAGFGYTEAGRFPVAYGIELQRTDEGFSVSVPDLPGCWSQGATEAEALENIEVAIAEYLEVRQGVERGIADADAGRIVPSDQVMAWLDRRR